MTVKEHTDEEIMEALEDMGEPCNCIFVQGTAIFGSPEMFDNDEKRCPVHGQPQERWSTVSFYGGPLDAS